MSFKVCIEWTMFIDDRHLLFQKMQFVNRDFLYIPDIHMPNTHPRNQTVAIRIPNQKINASSLDIVASKGGGASPHPVSGYLSALRFRWRMRAEAAPLM